MKGGFRMTASSSGHRSWGKIPRIRIIPVLSIALIPAMSALIGPVSSAQAATSGSKSPASVEKLTKIMHAPGHAPVGTDCTKGPLFGLRAKTVRAHIVCSKTSGSQIAIWGLQFNSRKEYQAGVAHLNHYTGFSAIRHVSTTCPPAHGRTAGLAGWHSLSNHKYKKRSGQFLECFIDTKKPLLIWTMPTQNAFFIGQDSAKHATIRIILHWWSTLAYG
jgi:hypothetical protein